MTHEKWAKLTPEQQRIKVAELCGWRIARNDDHVGWVGTTTCIGYHAKYRKDLIVVPDYLHDLNAMHEAEKSIPLVKLECYWQHLVRICSHPKLMLDGVEHGAVAIRATAAQRAEAFVLTMEPESN